MVDHLLEECDGEDFGGKTCQSFGFDGGMLVCTSASCHIVKACWSDPCEPDCEDKGCGDNGCGGQSPPGCDDGESCTEQGVCETGEGFFTCPDDYGACLFTGDCCVAKDTPGCEDPVIWDCVCDLDPVCCKTKWDEVCKISAQTWCGLVCD